MSRGKHHSRREVYAGRIKQRKALLTTETGIAVVPDSFREGDTVKPQTWDAVLVTIVNDSDSRKLLRQYATKFNLAVRPTEPDPDKADGWKIVGGDDRPRVDMGDPVASFERVYEVIGGTDTIGRLLAMAWVKDSCYVLDTQPPAFRSVASFEKGYAIRMG